MHFNHFLINDRMQLDETLTSRLLYISLYSHKVGLWVDLQIFYQWCTIPLIHFRKDAKRYTTGMYSVEHVVQDKIKQTALFFYNNYSKELCMLRWNSFPKTTYVIICGIIAQ